ncbi:hypothetical protein CRM89_00005 [Nocardia sp. FDAARGOS_372]|uniref:hypothetical protein n=1 Tax=Nocardia sp. FDAARGOS_372 TaxID=2018066 RepID=UPI000BF12E67|nr:hypothetical protein [Nocardia sp. FDAARGOS_372]PEH74577.1 hypothetical protein CRM89_00005 [Nocardia sp. FDAARGOS_372]
MIELPDETLIELEGCDGQCGRWLALASGARVCLADEDEGTDFDGMYESPVTAIYNSTAFEVGAHFGGTREEKFDFILACTSRREG